MAYNRDNRKASRACLRANALIRYEFTDVSRTILTLRAFIDEERLPHSQSLSIEIGEKLPATARRLFGDR
jgi:hypothetical protein